MNVYEFFNNIYHINNEKILQEIVKISDVRHLKKGQFVLLILFIVFIMLFATLLFADEQNGATSWLFGLQPSEFVKLAIIIYMAAVITNKQSKINNLVESFAAPALVCIFVFLL